MQCSPNIAEMRVTDKNQPISREVMNMGLLMFKTVHTYTDKKENQIFLIYKEIQSGAVAKSYIRKGLPIYEEMRKYFLIC